MRMAFQWFGLALRKGPNSTGCKQTQFRKRYILEFSEYQTMNRAQKTEILYAMHHRQSRLDTTNIKHYEFRNTWLYMKRNESEK
jgi:hypothetical protein